MSSLEPMSLTFGHFVDDDASETRSVPLKKCSTVGVAKKIVAGSWLL